jgi:hypothetical protein
MNKVNKVQNLAKICKEFFITKANNLSITSGFIKRKRKITGSSFIKALILGNIGDGHCTIEGMCQLLNEDSIDITKQGLDLRFTKSAVTFMKTMFKESIALFKSSLQLDCPILQQFNSVKLLDSSHVLLPSNMENIYKSCGASYKNRDNKTKSAIKLQVVFDYLNQNIDRLDVTEGIRADQGYRDHLKDIKSNDLLIADLGYFVPDCFRQISESKAYFISRYKSDTNIYDAKTNQKLDLLELLNHKSFLVKEVFLGKVTRLPIRIIGYKLTEEQSIARRRKANLSAKAHGYKSSDKNQELLNWSIFITNIQESKIKAKDIWTIYRTRWQIELLFKLYKSHIEIEIVKGKNNSSRILCELYAKLCSAIIFHCISSCVELSSNMEISLTKALIELQKRARELFVILNQNISNLYNFFKKLALDLSKFCLKDRYRKKRISSLNMLKSITINP